MATVSIFMKHDDRCYLSYNGPNEYGHPEFVVWEDGYMPEVNPILGGDTTELMIDNATGCIIGWTPIAIRDGKFVEEK